METAFASLIAAMSGAFPIEIINNTRWGIIMFIQGKKQEHVPAFKGTSLSCQGIFRPLYQFYTFGSHRNRFLKFRLFLGKDSAVAKQ